IGARRDYRVEVVVDQASQQTVDAHEKARAPFTSPRFLQENCSIVSGLHLVLGRNRVLEIDDYRVGAAAESLVEFPIAVGGNEEERSHSLLYWGRMRMNAWRRHSATSLLS